ncbi:hypothetical protein ABPG72_005728 [Tetrahymena utriculariae]
MEDQFQDPGMCQIHNRPFECYSLDENCLICPSCLMFGPNQGNKVCRIEEAAKKLRAKLSEAKDQNILQYERTENILLDIRHTKIECEEKKAQIMKEVELTFSNVIKVLKQRKEDVISELVEHFNQQIEQVYEQESKWVEKQETGAELANLLKEENDLVLIQKSNLILKGIESLKESQQYKQVKILNTLDTNFKASKLDSSIKEFLRDLEKFVVKGEVITIQYKC